MNWAASSKPGTFSPFVLVASASRLASNLDLSVMQTQPGFGQPRLYELADIVGRHGVGSALDPHGRVARNTHGQFLGFRVTPVRQRAQVRPFFGQFDLPQEIGTGANMDDELAVGRFADEVTGSAQSQMVLEPPLEVAIGRLDVALFVRTGDVNGGRSSP